MAKRAAERLPAMLRAGGVEGEVAARELRDLAELEASGGLPEISNLLHQLQHGHAEPPPQ